MSVPVLPNTSSNPVIRQGAADMNATLRVIHLNGWDTQAPVPQAAQPGYSYETTGSIATYTPASGSTLLGPPGSPPQPTVETRPATLSDPVVVSRQAPAASLQIQTMRGPGVTDAGISSAPASQSPYYAGVGNLPTSGGTTLASPDTASGSTVVSSPSASPSNATQDAALAALINSLAAGANPSAQTLPPPSVADVEALQPTPAQTSSSGPNMIVIIGVLAVVGVIVYLVYKGKIHL